MLQRNKEKSLITTIRNSAGNYTQSHQAINDTFWTFYSNLHTPENNPHPTTIYLFLDNVALLQVSIDQADKLDAPLTLTELHDALTQMPNYKALDGFPAEFFEHFWQILSLLFFKKILPPNEHCIHKSLIKTGQGLNS